jgi:hypothetical protein
VGRSAWPNFDPLIGQFGEVAARELQHRRPAANVVTFRDGLAVRIDAYGEWERALEAIGQDAARGSTTE